MIIIIHNYEAYTVKYMHDAYSVTVSTYFQGMPEQGKGLPVRYTRVKVELKWDRALKLKVRMKDWVSRLAAVFEGGRIKVKHKRFAGMFVVSGRPKAVVTKMFSEEVCDAFVRLGNVKAAIQNGLCIVEASEVLREMDELRRLRDLGVMLAEV